jgi:hypothetical protein
MERAGAERSAEAVALSLERIGGAEARTASIYRASVEARRKTDARPPPN